MAIMATFPFNKFPETILYKSADGAFCIASGYDKEDPQNEMLQKFSPSAFVG